MAQEISNREDTLDSRDIIERLEELQGERDALDQDIEDMREELDELKSDLEEAEEAEHDTDILQDKISGVNNDIGAAEESLREWGEDNAEELAVLKKLNEQGDSYGADWGYGATLIRDSYFEEYAQELAEDIGAIDRNAAWPACHIDWSQAAESLKQDYTSIDFAGVTYWVR